MSPPDLAMDQIHTLERSQYLPIEQGRKIKPGGHPRQTPGKAQSQTSRSMVPTLWGCATQNLQLHLCPVSPRHGHMDKTVTVAIIMGVLKQKG